MEKEKASHLQVNVPPSDRFPEGLRVLVVDNDPNYLHKLDAMLQSCGYHVTPCDKTKDALSLLRDRKERFDIVLADIDMVDMDGFYFLATVTAEFQSLPVVKNQERETGMKGIERGACAFFAKPILMEFLKMIWQYVYRERRTNFYNTQVDQKEELQKRKIYHCNDSVDHQESNQINARKKKPRVRWTPELQEKFQMAIKFIHQCREDVVPKKILECMENMGVRGLTRQNVSSHLQKVQAGMNKAAELEQMLPFPTSASSLIDPNNLYRDQYTEKMDVKGLIRQNVSSHLQKVQAGMDKAVELEQTLIPFSAPVSSLNDPNNLCYDQYFDSSFGCSNYNLLSASIFAPNPLLEPTVNIPCEYTTTGPGYSPMSSSHISPTEPMLIPNESWVGYLG